MRILEIRMEVETQGGPLIAAVQPSGRCSTVLLVVGSWAQPIRMIGDETDKTTVAVAMARMGPRVSCDYDLEKLVEACREVQG